MTLLLPPALKAQITQQALAAFPRECCGLIEGAAAGSGFAVRALHPGRNLAAEDNRFEIDPADHFAAVKAARAKHHDIIGCYHSHPGGTARPSQHDLRGAHAENFLWLIAATDGSLCQIAAFRYHGLGFEEVVVSAVGADFVTSSL